jgi:hypothetical protein
MTLALLIALAVLQALDGFTTRRILDQGGRELNPVMRAGFETIGFWPTIAIKGAAMVALGAWGANYAGLSAPGLLVVLYCAVVAWNWRQVRRR